LDLVRQGGVPPDVMKERKVERVTGGEGGGSAGGTECEILHGSGGLGPDRENTEAADELEKNRVLGLVGQPLYIALRRWPIDPPHGGERVGLGSRDGDGAGRLT
jgi:hypothetical protein